MYSHGKREFSGLLNIKHINERHGMHERENKALFSNEAIKKRRKAKLLTQGHAEGGQSVVQE